MAAYAAGARFFELKTVQVTDGADLRKCVPKPCISAEDEGYNCEWSTELTVPQAMEEYIKAWFACKLLAKELDLGDPEGFVFNMSVGYDLAGIRSPKVDAFIEGLKDASGTPAWKACTDWALANLDQFRRVDGDYVRAISPKVSRSVTESTLHGCPPEEIEAIAAYLMGEKGLHTYVKCNPTLLGYEFARRTLDDLGYGYLAFDDHHFRNDLQWADAVPMLRRLLALGEKAGAGLRGEAHQHLPGGGEGRGAAQRGDVYVRPGPVPPVPLPGGPADGGIRRCAAHLLLRRGGRAEHTPPGPGGHTPGDRGHHPPQARRVPAAGPDGGGPGRPARPAGGGGRGGGGGPGGGGPHRPPLPQAGKARPRAAK